MEEMIYIITNAEANWDCLMSAHKTVESIKEFYTVPMWVKTVKEIQDYMNERDNAIYVIHTTVLLPKSEEQITVDGKIF